MLGLTVDEKTGLFASDPAPHLLDADGSPLPPERYPIVEAVQSGTFAEDRLVGAARDDGSVVWGRLTVQPVEEEGATVAVVITFVDDTELILARRALAASEARLARAIDGTRDGLWEVDLQTGSAWFAPRFEEILGLAHGTLTASTEWADYLHPDDHVRVTAHWEQHLADEGPYDVRCRLRHRDGGWRHIHARGQAGRDADRHALRFSGAISDVTEQVEWMERRDMLKSRMEIAARVGSLAALAGGIAHDFNNLLAGMLGAADNARTTPSIPEEVQGDLALVIESAERAAGLTRQLSAYAAATPLAVETVATRDVVGDAARQVQGSMPPGTQLHTELDIGTPSVRADPHQLHQAVLNLLLNASEAVGPGGSVWVRTRCTQRHADALELTHSCYGTPGLYTIIEVVDDGVGMSPDTAAGVFEPFFTTEATGHGLGLATLHGMIRSHGGYVDVESQEGAGARFEVGLPAIDTPSEPRPVRQDRPQSRIGAGRVALIVDDETMVRVVLRRMLQREGFEVHERAEGDDLEATLQALQPHLLVLDVLLPGRSGLELLEVVRASGDRRPVLLSSGHLRTG